MFDVLDLRWSKEHSHSALIAALLRDPDTCELFCLCLGVPVPEDGSFGSVLHDTRVDEEGLTGRVQRRPMCVRSTRTATLSSWWR